jgi:hypothetical protein
VVHGFSPERTASRGLLPEAFFVVGAAAPAAVFAGLFLGVVRFAVAFLAVLFAAVRLAVALAAVLFAAVLFAAVRLAGALLVVALRAEVVLAVAFRVAVPADLVADFAAVVAAFLAAVLLVAVLFVGVALAAVLPVAALVLLVADPLRVRPLAFGVAEVLRDVDLAALRLADLAAGFALVLRAVFDAEREVDFLAAVCFTVALRTDDFFAAVFFAGALGIARSLHLGCGVITTTWCGEDMPANLPLQQETPKFSNTRAWARGPATGRPSRGAVRRPESGATGFSAPVRRLHMVL